MVIISMYISLCYIYKRRIDILYFHLYHHIFFIIYPFKKVVLFNSHSYLKVFKIELTLLIMIYNAICFDNTSKEPKNTIEWLLFQVYSV